MDSNKNLATAKVDLDPVKLDVVIRHALVEDIGKGDITTQLTIPKEKKIVAEVRVKEDCIICGLKVAERVFQISDKNIVFEAVAKDGQAIKKGKAVARIEGPAGSILTAERVALNMLSMLSGIATKTREYVKQIEPHKVKITDTRKTIPGLRELQKYAVRVGGGHNHRMGLDEMVLIKDNHIKVTDGYTKLPSVPKGFKIEIETQNLEEFKHALKFKPDVIMLDNMSVDQIAQAVKIRNSTEFTSHHAPTKLEASGGIDISSVKDIAASGVDMISIGELTHSFASTDIDLEIL